MATRKLITFDWAMKRLLRSKANFAILEGFLSELLHEDIIILDILESESNKETKTDKFNRVDLKVKNQKGEFIIIELQFEREYDYLQRMLYGTSRVITEHIKEGDDYTTLVKVISINIVYFELGHGSDYIYHGTTKLIGMHTNDTLQLDKKQQELFGNIQIHNIFPEYYILRVNNFDSIARNTLDEWIYFLKNAEIKDSFQAKGIQQAKQSFSVLSMSDEEYRAYQAYQDELHDAASWHQTYFTVPFMEGKAEGKAEGLAEGLAEGVQIGKQKGIAIGEERGIEKGAQQTKREISHKLMAKGMSAAEAAEIAGISVDDL